MNKKTILIGALLLLLPLQAVLADSSASSSSAPATLYDRIKNEVDDELTEATVEPEVIAYIRGIFEQEENLQLSDDDVKNAMKGVMPKACGNTYNCESVVQNIQRMVNDEERVRMLGRDLQLSATSNELPVSDLPGRSLQLSRDMQGLVSIWSADNFASSSSASSQSSSQSSSSASSLSPLPIRTKDVDTQTMQPLLQQLGDALNHLSDEERIAAVWHYQYGYRLTKGDRMPDYPAPYVDSQSTDGTERQYLFKTQQDVETALQKIWNAIVNDTYTPPLQSNETVLYVFPDDLLKDTLPDNVIVWARMDLPGKNKNHPLGDVGLQWKTPLDPVQPSLLSDEDGLPILGGNYPPQPIIPSQSQGQQPAPLDGRGLCTDPTQQRGYLCRVYTVANASDPCPDVVSASTPVDPTAITLVTCRKPSPLPTTIAGPDVCRNLSYQTPAPFNPQTQCKIQVDCNASGVPSTASAETDFKDSSGVIHIHLDNVSADIPETYLLYHELHHAYQGCNLPPGDPNAGATAPNTGYGFFKGDPNVACCEAEGEAYRAQCELMERDGLFKNMAPVDGIPFNAETCAEMETDKSCNHNDYGHCPVSRTYTSAFQDAMIHVGTSSTATCTDLYTTVNGQKQFKDARIQSLIDQIQSMKPVSSPGTVTNFSNRIGNEMCYIGQAVEESAEEHRLTGAQSPAVTGDESFPWNDPLTGVALGNQLVNPPLNSQPLPLYRPELVMNSLDTALCQLEGLPPKTPPILCAIQGEQAFKFPLMDPSKALEQLTQNLQDEQTASTNLLELAPTLGARIGTELYTDYLQTASRSLSDVVSQAVKLFKDMTSVNFPTQMCPTDQSLPPPVASAASSNP